jgi:hypothetical protein
MTCVKVFLEMKDWQLFLIFSGYAIGMSTLEAYSAHSMAAGVLSVVLFWALYGGWLWAIVSEANRRLDPSLRKSPRWMMLGMAYAALCMLGGEIFLSPLEGRKDMSGVAVLLGPSALLGMFYAMAFTARRLVTLERQQRVTFFDYSRMFFLFWFFPIGLWIIQPRVNKILGNRLKPGSVST